MIRLVDHDIRPGVTADEDGARNLIAVAKAITPETYPVSQSGA